MHEDVLNFPNSTTKIVMHNSLNMKAQVVANARSHNFYHVNLL